MPQSASPPPAPDEASAMFGSALPLAERYAQLLAGPGVERGLLGPRETPRLWDRHLLNCAAVAEIVPQPCSVIDVGSGAGLPGVILAILLPQAEVVLLEPMARRAAFLRECVGMLGLANATVRCSRAEDVVGDLAADVVTARAVAPLGRLAQLALGLVRPGGVLLAVKGESAAREVTDARPELRKAGVRDVEIVQAGIGRITPPAVVVRLRAASAGRQKTSGRHGTK